MRPSQQFNLHRPDHSLTDLSTTSFDVICIGSGWAGRVTAARIVSAGYTAVIVENELIGGDCPFWACVPSKVLLRSPEVLETAKSVTGARETIDPKQGVDIEATFKRRDMFTAGKDDTIVLVPMVESSGASIVRGHGRLVGMKKVEVMPIQGEPIVLDARLAVVISTGSEPIIDKNIKGLREADPWTPRDATSSSDVPEHLLIMGAGAVGCEMAMTYARYGAKVTVVGSSSEIIPGVDEEAGKIVRESMQRLGVTFHVGTRVVSVECPAQHQVIATLSNGRIVSGTELLVAAGREANLEGLGLDSVGVSANKPYLDVDESLCVKTSDGNWLYAAGDVNGRMLLTHTSKYHAGVVANTIIARAKNGNNPEGGAWSSYSATADKDAAPQVIFTDPVVATVGLTRKQAAARGKAVRAVTTSMASVGYSIHSDKPAVSWAQWLVDDEDRLVGATFVGTDAVEILHASTVAIVGGVKLQRLMHAIPCFPTLSWVYYNLMDAAGI